MLSKWQWKGKKGVDSILQKKLHFFVVKKPGCTVSPPPRTWEWQTDSKKTIALLPSHLFYLAFTTTNCTSELCVCMSKSFHYLRLIISHGWHSFCTDTFPKWYLMLYEITLQILSHNLTGKCGCTLSLKNTCRAKRPVKELYILVVITKWSTNWE